MHSSDEDDISCEFYNRVNNLSTLINECVEDVSCSDVENVSCSDVENVSCSDVEDVNTDRGIKKLVYIDIPNYRVHPQVNIPINKVYICTFTIVESCIYPYLLFLGKKTSDVSGKNTTLCMPSFLFKSPNSNKEVNNALIIDRTLTIMDILFHDDDISYAGYTNVLDGVVIFIKLVVINTKSVYDYHYRDNDNNDYLWLLGCEIINSRISETLKISDTMYSMFLDNPSLLVLYDSNDNIIKQPSIGYAKTNNYYFDKKTQEYILYRNISKNRNAINNMITFDSEYPNYISSNNTLNNYQKIKTFRVAIFIQNSKCILDQIYKPSLNDTSVLLYIYAGRLHYAIEDPRCYTILSVC